MTCAAIELGDAGILVVGDDGVVRAPGSPGYALLDGNRLLIGLEALAEARLRPRSVHNRFWRDLGTEPLGRPFLREVTAADLAHAHLERVWTAAGAGIDRALLVVPGTFSEHQLGLALGIARAAAIPVVGLVDAAVAAAAGRGGRRFLHLDLQLHQAVLTELERSGDLARGALEIAPGLGLAGLADLWAQRVAASFVRRTRFDPLHAASSEQALYMKLPTWLDEVHRAESTEAILEIGERRHTVELTRAEMVAAADERYRQLVDLVRGMKRPREAVSLLVADRAARLPGLFALLADLPDVDAVPLEPGAAARGALRRRESIEAPGDALPFVTRLPLARPPRREAGAP